MSLAAELEQTILTHRLMPVSARWADEVVFPAYDGLSIRNLAHTVVCLLDDGQPGAGLGSAPLDRRLWEHLRDPIRRVVLFISDGLGWRLLQDIMAEDAQTAQIVADLTGDGTLTPITSCVPSTTAAALPCIWTGAGPAATGMVGTQLFLREFGMLVSMLHYWPLVGRHPQDVLVDWGLDPDTLMPLPTLGEELALRRVRVYQLLQKELYGSGLSRIMHRGIRRTARHFTYTDLWPTLRDLLHTTRRKRCLVSVYWGAVDGISHLHGTASEQTITEIRRQLGDLRDVLLGGHTQDGRSLFIFAADHGHTPVPKSLNVSEHPPLADALRCGLGGEGRFGYWYLRHDLRAQVIDYLDTHLSETTAWLLPGDALAAGLYGPEMPHPETAARLGDLTVFARADWTIGDRPPSRLASVSRHGGLSAREMLVPLLLRVW